MIRGRFCINYMAFCRENRSFRPTSETEGCVLRAGRGPGLPWESDQTGRGASGRTAVEDNTLEGIDLIKRQRSTGRRASEHSPR